MIFVKFQMVQLCCRAHEYLQLSMMLQKKLKLYDATCPYVGNIHKRVQMMYEEGYKIIIVGVKYAS